MKSLKKQTEQGSASIIIELRNGNIVVKHGTDKATLKSIDNAVQGSWEKIWKTLNSIQTIEQ